MFSYHPHGVFPSCTFQRTGRLLWNPLHLMKFMNFWCMIRLMR